MGSHGDMLPFFGLGAELKVRGHDVRFYGNAHFEPLATAVGVNFVATSAAELLRASLDDEGMTQSRTGLKAIASRLMETVEPTYEAMRQDVLPGATAVIGSTLAFSPRLLAETHGLPFVAVHLAPSTFRSDHLAPRLTPLGYFEHWPQGFKRGMWKFMDRRLLDPHFTEPLNVIRRRLGLEPVERIFHRWIHEATVAVGLFPDWFAPRQPDWPEGVILAGFPAQVKDAIEALPPELEAFLNAGQPPIVFTAGTANTNSQRFYEESAQACMRLGRRGVLVAQDAKQVPSALPASLLHARWAPFGTLLPRVAAVVHHGGIGTVAAALSAGIPQLIQPMAFDQFDNASRAQRLNVAREVLPRAYRARRVAQVLGECLSDLGMGAACKTQAQAMQQQDGVGVACTAIEAAVIKSDAQSGTA